MDTEKLKPLSSIEEGKAVIIAEIDAGEGLKNRLTAMGMLKDTEIKVLNNHHSGPFVVSFKNSKVALGRGMASKIMVKKTID